MPPDALKGLTGEAAGRKERAFGAKAIDEAKCVGDLFGILVDYTLTERVGEYNAKPALLVACCKVMGVDLAAMMKAEQTAVKDAEKAKKDAKAGKKPTKAAQIAATGYGTCKSCGCTDDHACEEGCGWVDHTHTLCSACVEAEPGDKPEPKVPGKKATTAPAKKASFKIGQYVSYREGEGTFDALVTLVDGDTLTLERFKDGKKVTRPASKVEAAS